MRAKDRTRQRRTKERVRLALKELNIQNSTRAKLRGRRQAPITLGYTRALKEYKATKRTAKQ